MNLPHPKVDCVLKSWTSWSCQHWFSSVLQSADLDISLNGLWTVGTYLLRMKAKSSAYPNGTSEEGRMEGRQTKKLSVSLTRIDQRSGVSHVSCVTKTLANAQHLPDALKIHSQPCCKVHPNSAELKSYNVRSGKECNSSSSRWRKRFKKILSNLNPYP
jgi:hypothetical protein